MLANVGQNMKIAKSASRFGVASGIRNRISVDSVSIRITIIVRSQQPP